MGILPDFEWFLLQHIAASACLCVGMFILGFITACIAVGHSETAWGGIPGFAAIFGGIGLFRFSIERIKQIETRVQFTDGEESND